MRVLVIEDYAPLLRSLCQGLQEAGFAVDAAADGEEGLAFAEQNLRAEPNAFPFSNVDQTGIWYEGTAHMALVYRLTGQSARAEELLQVIRSARYPSGAIPAASKDGLRTGFNVFERVEWHLFRRAHTGATAWTILAERGFNPFATAPAQ